MIEPPRRLSIRRAPVLLLLAPLLLAFPGVARADLDEYLARPEPAYKWEKHGEKGDQESRAREFDLTFVSQVWQGHTWEHRLLLFRPERLAHPRFCVLYNAGGNGG